MNRLFLGISVSSPWLVSKSKVSARVSTHLVSAGRKLSDSGLLTRVGVEAVIAEEFGSSTHGVASLL